MFNSITKYTKFFFLIIGFLIFLPQQTLASQTNGTIDSTFKFTWGENIGWINFGTIEGNVHVLNTGLTGYAWIENYGWMNLNPSSTGANTTSVTNNGEGILGGYAWSEQLGWINFTGVTIDINGVFSGFATILTDNSKISFNCANTSSCAGSNFKIVTDWRPIRAQISGGVLLSGGGGGGGAIQSQPQPELQTQKVITPAPIKKPIIKKKLPARPKKVFKPLIFNAKKNDIVKDGIYDVKDFNMIMVHWGKRENNNPIDLNKDGSVNIFDFNLLMVHWGVKYKK